MESLNKANKYNFGLLFLFICTFGHIAESYSFPNLRYSKVNLNPKDSLTNDSLKIVIPDSSTAIKIGMVILSTIYGNKYIKRCRPFTAILIDNDTWKVYGSVYRYYLLGGEPTILLSRKDARVKNVYHTR